MKVLVLLQILLIGFFLSACGENAQLSESYDQQSLSSVDGLYGEWQLESFNGDLVEEEFFIKILSPEALFGGQGCNSSLMLAGTSFFADNEVDGVQAADRSLGGCHALINVGDEPSVAVIFSSQALHGLEIISLDAELLVLESIESGDRYELVVRP